MTSNTPQLNPSTNYRRSDPEEHNIHDTIKQHPIIVVIVVISVFAIIALIIFLLSGFFSSSQDPATDQDPELAPVPIFEQSYFIESSIDNNDNLADQLVYIVKSLVIDPDELATAPHKNDNSDPQFYTIAVDESSYDSTEFDPNTTIFTMNFSVSDGRKYALTIFYNYDYRNESAIAVIQRTDDPDLPAHVTTFTDYTPDYYTNLDLSEDDENYVKVDHTNDGTYKQSITNDPLQPLSATATDWLNSLKLKDPQIAHEAIY